MIGKLRFVSAIAALFAAACFGPAAKPGGEDGEARRGGPQAAQTRGADGVRIAYTLYGEGDETLVLVHGWGGSQTQWASQVDDLAQRYTVITVDLGGHGASGSRAAPTLAKLAEDLEAVLAAADLRGAVVVGHSLGGLVALEAARAKPQAVAGVIGVEAFHDPPLPPPLWDEVIASLVADFPGGCRSFVRGLFAAATEEMLVDENAEEICRRTDPAAGVALLRELSRADLGKALAALPASLPVRSIEASEEPDPSEPSGLAADAPAAPAPPPAPRPEPLRRFHANVASSMIYRCGHFPMLEQSAELTRQLAGYAQEILKR